MEPQEIGTLEANLRRVRERIRAACERAGRSEDEVRLIAVTKYTTVEVIRALIELGVEDIGESRVQDTLRKRAELGGSPARWHLIGHLQRNKVGKALEAYDLIHSVDSVRLGEELDRRAEHPVEVLVQVNVSGEASKSGLPSEGLSELLEQAASWRNVRVLGLMTIAPQLGQAGYEDPEDLRPVFAELRELMSSANRSGSFADQLVHLSMGMTQDFEVAIEEGATLVRVGSALLEGLESTARTAN